MPLVCSDKAILSEKVQRLEAEVRKMVRYIFTCMQSGYDQPYKISSVCIT